MLTDVTILGSGVAGLTSGALLAKRGLKVVLVEETSNIGGICNSIREKGYCFDTELSPLFGVESGEVFHWLFNELKVDELLYNNEVFHKLDPPLQLIHPDFRININSDRIRFMEDFQKEFPEYSQSVYELLCDMDSLENDIYHSYPEKHFCSMESYYSFDKKKHNLKNKLQFSQKKKITFFDFLKKKNLTCMFDFFSLLLSQTGEVDLSHLHLPMASIILGLPNRGIFQVKGGKIKLAELLKKQILSNGGKVLTNHQITEIVLNKKRVSGVRIKNDEEVIKIRSKYVISNKSFDEINGKLLNWKGNILNIFRKNRSNNKMKFNVPFTVFLGVDEKVIPEPMKENVIFMRSKELPPKHNNILFINISPEKDDRAPAGKRTLSATYWLPNEESRAINWEKEINIKTEETIGFLEQVIPFLPEYVDVVGAISPNDYKHLTSREGRSMNWSNYGGGIPEYEITTPIKFLYSAANKSGVYCNASSAAKIGIIIADNIT